jgi:hypothetical protein
MGNGGVAFWQNPMALIAPMMDARLARKANRPPGIKQDPMTSLSRYSPIWDNKTGVRTGMRRTDFTVDWP